MGKQVPVIMARYLLSHFTFYFFKIPQAADQYKVNSGLMHET